MSKITLKGYYAKLESESPKKKFKDEVIKLTGISNSMFYNYVQGRWPVPDIYREAFSKASGINLDELFPKLTFHE